MAVGIVHMILTLCMTFLLGSCITQFVIFISNQGLLGAHGLRYPSLRVKRLADWEDYEREYVLARILKDLMLVALFVLQHSLMACEWWKKLLLRFNIYVSERLLYVMASCFVLSMMINRWVSTPDVLLWGIDTDERPLLWLFFFLLHAAGWAIIFLEIRMMDPLELIGIKQIYNYHTGKSAPTSYMAKGLRLFYQHLRHGGTVCLWLMLWVHPVMTLDRLLLALVFTFYLPVAQQVTLSDHKFACTYFGRTMVTTTTTSTKHRAFRN
ncbi:nurim homolog [Babylonia areolata]|uniref:nurim homolog n=1 Tax=Babylonia areolata TaxID=304850 RepID=UPI003FCF2E73